MTWDGQRYQRRFDELAAKGEHVHGEADFVMEYLPASVLDAGCGTGRVAIELAHRGVEVVVGVDRDPSMLEVARARASTVRWVEADLAELDLGTAFDVVVLAGNVPLFATLGTETSLITACGRHVADDGCMITGFELDGRFGLGALDEAANRAGLTLAERWSTWHREAFPGDGSYAVSVHRR